MLNWNVRHEDDNKIRALVKFLGPGWAAIWDDERSEKRGRDVLVFVSPQLMLKYATLCGWSKLSLDRLRQNFFLKE